MLGRPPDDAALITAVAFHVEVTIVGDGEDVRGHLPNLLVGVLADVLWRVDGKQLVGVHSHQDGACVCLWITKTKELTTSRVGGSDCRKRSGLPASILWKGQHWLWSHMALGSESCLPMIWGQVFRLVLGLAQSRGQ